MSEATYVRGRHDRRETAAAAITSGTIHQLADGQAAVYTGLQGASAGERIGYTTEGQFTIPKTASVVITDGQPVYFDHSARTATYASANDRDFFLGVAVGDAAASDTHLVVNLNVPPVYLIDLNKDPARTVLVFTAGTPTILRTGGSSSLRFSATAEAQKIDLISVAGFAVGSNWIVEGQFTVTDNGDAAAGDFNIGVANGTHASDADSITESCFLHFDFNALDIYAESDDGTTEVPATDTTINLAEGTPVHFVIDGRNPEDIQIYINGALVLGSTVFKLNAATGPLKLLAHLEKTADDTPGQVDVDFLRVRIAQQD